MDAFHQKVGSYENLSALWKLEHGAVVAHAILARFVLELDVLGKMLNQTEFA